MVKQSPVGCSHSVIVIASVLVHMQYPPCICFWSSRQVSYTHLPTVRGNKKQKWHRGHILLQSSFPLVQRQSRDNLAEVTSIAGVDKLYKTAGLENTMTSPRKPGNVPRRVIRIGIPETEKVETWVSLNNLLAGDETLAEEAARILRAAPQWLQRCGVHANMDPVLGR
jgi:hypothetical protein